MIYPVAVLTIACVGLGYGLFTFAHGRLVGADVAEWERLHSSGLLAVNSSLAQDFRTVTYLLQTISGAVEMQTEPWVRGYFTLLRAVQSLARSARPLEQELRRLVAYQAVQYRLACARMADVAAE
ncbi:MAG: hypothetical protein ACRD2E_04540 [Terriglobales bacterium]